MAAALGTDTVPAVVEDGKQAGIIAAGPVGQLTHGVKPALGEGPPSFLADRGDERLLDAVLGGGLHLPDPMRRLWSEGYRRAPDQPLWLSLRLLPLFEAPPRPTL